MTKMLSVATAAVLKEQMADVNHKRFPRVDYLELQNFLNADTIDYSAYNGNYMGKFFRQFETQLRSDIYLATLGWLRSRDHRIVFTWSERAGIPFAIYKRFLRSRQHFVTMFQCWSNRQEFVITKLGLFSAMNDIIVHCKSMQQRLIRLGATASQVKLIHYSVDQSFFSPQTEGGPRENLILSVGEPRSRDYGSLLNAMEGLPVELKIAASGHWYAREKRQTLQLRIPQNTSILGRLSQIDLRKLYASSQFVVLPIRDLAYSAGATAALEAGSMARAVIAFRSQAIVDYVSDGETGILVDPGDSEALKSAIQFLIANPAEAKRLGQNARERIVREFNLETYVKSLANVLMRAQQF